MPGPNHLKPQRNIVSPYNAPIQTYNTPPRRRIAPANESATGRSKKCDLRPWHYLGIQLALASGMQALNHFPRLCNEQCGTTNGKCDDPDKIKIDPTKPQKGDTDPSVDDGRYKSDCRQQSRGVNRQGGESDRQGTAHTHVVRGRRPQAKRDHHRN